MVLEWNTNNDLTTQRDKNGSTPLHFAAGLVPPPWERRMLTLSRRGSVVFSEKLASKILKRNVFAQVLEANTAAVYQPDNAGLYPIHVAASVGAEHAIALIVEKYGGTTTSAGLRDTKGRTFLHVAVEEKQVGIVCYACGNRSLEWIMNMQDSDGNTALHLAVKAGSLRVFSALFGNKHVSLNLANMKEETPLDIAAYSIAPGVHYGPDSEVRIFQALLEARAMRGTSRQDHLKENYKKIHGRQIEYEKKDMEKLKDSTQTVCIGSVLIATVTFGSTFALPGGYRADDHTNGGTPTLAGRYAFDAFVIANTLAFVLSSLATFLLLRSGNPYINIRSRRLYSIIAFNLVDASVTCLVAAFALAVYVVLGSVARNTAIAAGVLSLLVVICTNADSWLKSAILARPLFFRRGGPRLSLLFHYSVALVGMFHACWPFLVIFLWATYGRNHHPIAMSGSPAPAPPPLG